MKNWCGRGSFLAYLQSDGHIICCHNYKETQNSSYFIFNILSGNQKLSLSGILITLHSLLGVDI